MTPTTEYDEWRDIHLRATAEERRVIAYYRELIAKYADDGSLRRRVLPLFNRIIVEGENCFEYRQNAPFYRAVFRVVQTHCIDPENVIADMIRQLDALVAQHGIRQR